MRFGQVQRFPCPKRIRGWKVMSEKVAVDCSGQIDPALYFRKKS